MSWCSKSLRTTNCVIYRLTWKHSQHSLSYMMNIKNMMSTKFWQAPDKTQQCASVLLHLHSTMHENTIGRAGQMRPLEYPATPLMTTKIPYNGYRSQPKLRSAPSQGGLRSASPHTLFPSQRAQGSLWKIFGPISLKFHFWFGKRFQVYPTTWISESL